MGSRDQDVDFPESHYLAYPGSVSNWNVYHTASFKKKKFAWFWLGSFLAP